MKVSEKLPHMHGELFLYLQDHERDKRLVKSAAFGPTATDRQLPNTDDIKKVFLWYYLIIYRIECHNITELYADSTKHISGPRVENP
jgi:hypothetical protein